MRTSGKRSGCVVAIGSFLAIVSFPLLMLVGWHGVAIGGQLTATWIDSSNNELGFSIERSTGTTGTFAEIGRTGAGITAYADASAADSTTYCYRVRAYDTTTYSNYSNVACATTASALSLEVVSGTGAVISSGTFASGTTVTLTATPATGSTFTGWSGGGCSGTGTCTVTLT